MESKKRVVPEWCNIKCEKIVEEIAPGFKCVKNAKTGEVLAFIHEELDDNMLEEGAVQMVNDAVIDEWKSDLNPNK